MEAEIKFSLSLSHTHTHIHTHTHTHTHSEYTQGKEQDTLRVSGGGREGGGIFFGQ
jgi:hypothetical protein